jgi:hypothetical protein
VVDRTHQAPSSDADGDRCIICLMVKVPANCPVGGCTQPMCVPCLARWLQDHDTWPGCRGGLSPDRLDEAPVRGQPCEICRGFVRENHGGDGTSCDHSYCLRCLERSCDDRDCDTASPIRNIRNGSGLLFCPAPESLALRYTLNMNAFAAEVREHFLILFVVLGDVEGTSFASEGVERSCLLYFLLGYFDSNGAFR